MAKKSSKEIVLLTPFLDENGIIRVGGRLQNSHRTFEQKSPVLLPQNCMLTTLIMHHLHFKFKHAGPQLLASLIDDTHLIYPVHS